MKDELEALRVSIKALIDETDKLISDGKLEEAKVKQVEIKKLQEQAQVLKAQAEAKAAEDKMSGELKAQQLEKENADLKAKLKDPVRLEGLAGDISALETDTKGEAQKATYQTRYGTIDAGVKAVLSDLYGSEFNYNQARDEQMKAFVKYIRLGENRLTAKEIEMLTPKWNNIILRPDVIKSELEAGRSVAEIKATLVEGTLDLGGYTVPEDYRVNIISRLVGNTVVRKRARVVTTTRDAIEWPKLEGGNTIYTSAVRVTWVQEQPASATAASTNPTFGLYRIPVHTVMARTDFSRNLLEDSAFNLQETIAGLFAEAMAVDEDNQFLTGTGGGTPRGVLAGRSSGAEQTPETGVTAVVSGNASAVTADGLLDLVYAVAQQYRNSAAFAVSRTTQRDLRKLKDGNGRYMWQDSIQQGQPPALLGYAVDESESMPTIAANAYPIIFGSWLGYLVADRVGMSVERVTDSTLVGQNRVALFARRRLGGQVIEPWRFAAQQMSV